MRKGMLFLLSIICLMSIWIVRNNEQTKQGTAARETVSSGSRMSRTRVRI